MLIAKIGEIILERNEIQTRRQAIRKKLWRAKRYLHARKMHMCNCEACVSNGTVSDKHHQNYLPKRFRTVPVADMKLIMMQHNHQMTGVDLELAEFTKRTHARLMRLLKQDRMQLEYRGADNKVTGVVHRDRFYSISQIKHSVDMMYIENILLEEEV